MTIWSSIKSKPAAYTALVLLTLAAYALVVRNEFIGFDDDYYITQNQVVRAGLTWPGIKWAFTTFDCANWHPLTWLSHMTDVQLFGLYPAGHHAVNLAFHIVSALLLFSFLGNVTGERGKSFFVAALFALHPLHVESVAWAAERKDVLSHFFFILMLPVYARYARKRSMGAYAAVLVLLALGLMAKPMLVSAPLLLLLIDYWPLERFSLDRSGLGALKRCVLEKIPLAVLSVGSSVLTVAAQRAGGAVRTLDAIALPQRVLNAGLAYFWYIEKTFVPLRLGVLYPYAQPPVVRAAAAVAILAAATLVVLALARRHRFLVVGWLWFLISLVPVIGLVQVGSQSHADRYTYLPHTGLFICLAWGVPLAARRLPAKEKLLPAAAAIALVLLGAVTWRQVAFWKDSETLFTRAIAVTQKNANAHYNLGCTYLKKAEYKAAAENFVTALQYKPDDIEAMTNLGVVMMSVNELDKAASCLEQVLAKKPNYEYAIYNLSVVRYGQNNYQAAAVEAQKLVLANPAYTPAKSVLGRSLYHLGRMSEAERLLREVVKADPNDQQARQYLFKLTGES
ncbi:MAG: tetratricopeptide repeat protein [Candidatus Hydrogenedentes bacterium]|nr:tetratricopeptide repeat protein [Candidatus Hydrogenedentota bacterium]